MSGQVKLQSRMSVAEFLDWVPHDGRKWQLVDGVPRAMAPARIGHGSLQSALIYLLLSHLLETGRNCDVVTTPGIIPATMAAHNMRVPDVAVSCVPQAADQTAMKDPVIIVEILSPSNSADTWANVWAYTSIPSVMEIVILQSDAIGGDLLRRDADGAWPDQTEPLVNDLILNSVGFQSPLAALYARTGLSRP
jgi:Uma2 family endonuclease